MKNLVSKMRGKLKYLLVAALTICAMAVPAFASGETTGTANTQVTSAMQSLAADMIATGNAIIPIALTVVGIAMVVLFGIRIFKSVAKP